jgi:hypothetical protein
MRLQTVFGHLSDCSRVNFLRWTRFWGPFRVLKCPELLQGVRTLMVNQLKVQVWFNQCRYNDIAWQQFFGILLRCSVFQNNNVNTLCLVCLKTKRVTRNSVPVLSEQLCLREYRHILPGSWSPGGWRLLCHGITTVQSLSAVFAKHKFRRFQTVQNAKRTSKTCSAWKVDSRTVQQESKHRLESHMSVTQHLVKIEQ